MMKIVAPSLACDEVTKMKGVCNHAVSNKIDKGAVHADRRPGRSKVPDEKADCADVFVRAVSTEKMPWPN
jgi:hypothetical protein